MRRYAESPSSISKYLSCPASYKFKYVEKLPDPSGPAAELGNLFHKAAYASWHTMDFTNGDAEVSRMLRALYEHPKVRELPHPKLVDGNTCEYKLSVDAGGQKLFGYVDLLLDDVGFAIDFKTSSKPWTEQKIYENMQHLAYTYGLRKLGRSPVKKFLYIVVTSGKNPQCQYIELDVSDELCAHYASKFNSTVQRIELDLFMPTPERRICGWCNFKRVCPAWKDGNSPF